MYCVVMGAEKCQCGACDMGERAKHTLDDLLMTHSVAHLVGVIGQQLTEPPAAA